MDLFFANEDPYSHSSMAHVTRHMHGEMEGDTFDGIGMQMAGRSGWWLVSTPLKNDGVRQLG
jgi:hypothetical protein